jgi:small subunit ribosomal protein S21
MAKKKVNVEVHLRNREPVERMIKRFLNKVKKEKIVEELRNREFYEPPSVIRARRKARRRKVIAKLQRERESLDKISNK